ncbi:hypothetical protein HanLR1_Chr16g0615381 [Helianthus annuus]|nr:hypothetical protein HanLR1_Chr16g0615381 [Helianthus annuus]
MLGGAFDHPDVVVCRLHAAASVQHWRWGPSHSLLDKGCLTRRQDYENSNGGFGRGQVKPLSDATAEKGVSEQIVNSSAAEKNDEGTAGEASCVDKWLQELAALRSRIEKALSDRLTGEPDNEDHRRLKRKYLEVLDVLPCLPAEGKETFEEGEMLKRAVGGTSSPPSALAGNRTVFFAAQSACVFFTLLIFCRGT